MNDCLPLQRWTELCYTCILRHSLHLLSLISSCLALYQTGPINTNLSSKSKKCRTAQGKLLFICM